MGRSSRRGDGNATWQAKPGRRRAEEAKAEPPVVTLDTNLVPFALVFASGRLALLRSARQTGRCSPLVSRATASEVMRVLWHSKFELSRADREELLADYLPYCRSVRIPMRLPKLPACRTRTIRCSSSWRQQEKRLVW